VAKVPELAINPITLACPRCDAEPGKPCLELGEECFEAVHFERVKAALQELEQQTRNRAIEFETAA
jgi:hypothetical protein